MVYAFPDFAITLNLFTTDIGIGKKILYRILMDLYVDKETLNSGEFISIKL